MNSRDGSFSNTKSSYSHLSNPKMSISVKKLMERTKTDLEQIFKDVPGEKTLVFDEQIVSALVHIVEVNEWPHYEISSKLKLNDNPLPMSSAKSVIYIVHSKIEFIKQIAMQIKHYTKQKNQYYLNNGKNSNVEDANQLFVEKRFYVYLVPRITLICKQLIQELKIENDIILREYHLDLIPFDYDILSMEIPSVYKECHLNGDFSSLDSIARAIITLQSIYGIIPHIKVKGYSALKVYEMLQKLPMTNEVHKIIPEIDTLILFDRQVDLITPMLTQLTYEGVIDELFSVRNRFLIPTFPCSTEQKNGQREKILLCSADTVFSEIRDLNQMYVGHQLKQKVLQLKEIKSRHNLQTVEQMKEISYKIPQIKEEKKNVMIHVAIIEKINTVLGDPSFRRCIEIQQALLMNEDKERAYELIEEYIVRQESLTKVLRLLCLLSLVNNGIKESIYDTLRSEMIQTYGYEVILTLNNLENMGLLKKQAGKSNWPLIRNGLALFKNENLQRNDLHATYSVYAPLSVRLMEEAMNKPKKEIVELLPGPSREFQQKKTHILHQQDRKVVLCFFIGGITAAEMSAIRYLNEKYAQLSEDGQPSKIFLVATTKIITGNNFIESLIENSGNILSKTHTYMLQQQEREFEKLRETAVASNEQTKKMIPK